MSDSRGGFGAVEKRSTVRRRVHWRLLILIAGEKKPGYVTDISEGGMQIQSLYSFPGGTVINVAVFVPEAHKPGSYLVTQLGCRVIYQVMKGSDVLLGVSFVDLPEAARQRISAAMSYS